jgi:adenine-specific DNA-methyltransferase
VTALCLSVIRPSPFPLPRGERDSVYTLSPRGERDSVYTLSPIGGEGRVRGQVHEHLRRYARRLRRDQTDAERKLWSRLRDRRLFGARFRRQHPIGPFIADFCCTEAKLAIELDGGQHAVQKRSDAERTAFLEGQGYRVIRFWDNEALANTEGVLLRIVEALGVKGPSPSPYPLPKGEREIERPIRMKPSPQPGEGRVRGL